MMTKEIETCPIEATLSIINRKWVVIIIRDMFTGKKRFSEFKKDNPNLNNNVLSNTLHFMEENKIITKKTIEGITMYSLTRKGRNLNKILYQMAEYGIDELMMETSECEDLKKRYKEILGV